MVCGKFLLKLERRGEKFEKKKLVYHVLLLCLKCWPYDMLHTIRSVCNIAFRVMANLNCTRDSLTPFRNYGTRTKLKLESPDNFWGLDGILKWVLLMGTRLNLSNVVGKLFICDSNPCWQRNYLQRVVLMPRIEKPRFPSCENMWTHRVIQHLRPVWRSFFKAQFSCNTLHKSHVW